MKYGYHINSFSLTEFIYGSYMMKMKENIYDYQFIDGRKETLKFFSAFCILLLWLDLSSLEVLNMVYNENYFNWLIYTMFFRIVFLLPFVYISKWVYKYNIYLVYAAIIVVVPSLLLSVLAYFSMFGLQVAIVYLVIFFSIIYWIYLLILNSMEIDYKIAVKKLLSYYPNDFYLQLYRNDIIRPAVIKKNIKIEEEENIFLKLYYNTPLPVIIMTPVGLLLIGLITTTPKIGWIIGLTAIGFIGSMLVVVGMVNRHRYKIIFEEAQKILDEEAKIK